MIDYNKRHKNVAQRVQEAMEGLEIDEKQFAEVFSVEFNIQRVTTLGLVRHLKNGLLYVSTARKINYPSVSLDRTSRMLYALGFSEDDPLIFYIKEMTRGDFNYPPEAPLDKEVLLKRVAELRRGKVSLNLEQKLRQLKYQDRIAVEEIVDKYIKSYKTKR